MYHQNKLFKGEKIQKKFDVMEKKHGKNSRRNRKNRRV